MQLVNESEQMNSCVRVYGTPTLDVIYLYDNDVVTASNPNDNNFSDIEDWD